MSREEKQNNRYYELYDESLRLRSKRSEFTGLNAYLRESQAALLERFNSSASVKHPRDIGHIREELLREFLTESGLLPANVRIPSVSTRAVSETGHISPELDLLLLSRSAALTLKKFEGSIEYHPIESAYGTIQVKSKLNKKELFNGLENIRRFKELIPRSPIEEKRGQLTIAFGADKRFGILFAYDSKIKWKTLYNHIKDYCDDCPKEFWPNFICVLNKGNFTLGTKDKYCLTQKDINEIDELVLHGFPEQTTNCMGHFYTTLIQLIDSVVTGRPDVTNYMDLPHVCGPYSYRIFGGPLNDTLRCSAHGPYLKSINEQSAKRILAVLDNVDPINWVRAIDIARGKPGDDWECYDKNQGDTLIYNPDNIPWFDLLLTDEGFFKFEIIDLDWKRVWLPWHYIATDDLFEKCPVCQKS